MQVVVNIQEGKRGIGIKRCMVLLTPEGFLLILNQVCTSWIACFIHACYECAFACVWRPEVKFRYSSYYSYSCSPVSYWPEAH